MLYLEDYLEMIEHLPQELRDRFTEMREMDLAVQNNTDALDKRVRTLFQQCRRGEISSIMADSEFHSIRTNYYRVLDDSDEKIQLAAQMYDLVERYLRRLDTELFKFKCELEADHNGITDLLEKRSLELDSTTSNGGYNQKENRFHDTQNSFGSSHSSRSESRYKIKADKRRESIAATNISSTEKRPIVAASGSVSKPLKNTSNHAVPTVAPDIVEVSGSTVGIVDGIDVVATLGDVGGIGTSSASSVGTHSAMSTSPGSSGATYNLQKCGAGNAIVVAASQAIAQTQQMQQGRRTASLKASYEAIGGGGSHELLLNSELAGATHNALNAVEREANAYTNQRRPKKKNIITSSGSGSARVNTTVVTNNSSVASILSSPASNIKISSNSSSTTSVAFQVHPVPLQQQQMSTIANQPNQQSQQQQPIVHNLGQQTAMQQQQLLMQQNSPVALQQSLQVFHTQPIVQQITLQQQPSQPVLKQQLQSQQQHQLTNPQQKQVQLDSTTQASQHRLMRQLQQQQQLQQPMQNLQPMQTQHHQQSQLLQHAQLLQQPQLQSVNQQQLLHVKSQQKPQQLQTVKAVHNSTFQPQSLQTQQQIVQHLQHIPIQQQQQQKDVQFHVQQQQQQVLQQKHQILLQQTPLQVGQQQLLHQNAQQLQQQKQVQQYQKNQLHQKHQHQLPQQQQHVQNKQQLMQQIPGQQSKQAQPPAQLQQISQPVAQQSFLTTTTTYVTSDPSTSTNTATNNSADSGTATDQVPEGEWFDPNEPRYCLCNQVSYGDMVACDNEDCPFEWFHYPCVNIISSPKGKWYCPQCSSSMKRRAARKN